jgi:predicted aspartyl protease
MRNLAARDAESKHAGRTPTFDLAECDGHFQVVATVAGHEARLEVDTGAMATTIYSASDAGGVLVGQVPQWSRVGRGASGTTPITAVLDAVPVRVGSIRVEASLEVMLAKGNVDLRCGFDGVLGTDFLVAHRCALRVEVERMRGYCEP